MIVAAVYYMALVKEPIDGAIEEAEYSKITSVKCFDMLDSFFARLSVGHNLEVETVENALRSIERMRGREYIPGSIFKVREFQWGGTL